MSMKTKMPVLVQIQRWWLLFLITVIPFSTHYVVEKPFAISYLNIISVGFIALGILNLLLGYFPQKKLPHRYFWYTVGLFFLVLVWGLLFSHPLRTAVGIWTSRSTQPFLVGWFSFLMLENGYMKVSDYVAALFVSLPILLVIGGLQVVGVLPYTDPHRVTASYFFPNTFARYIDIILTISLPWILFSLRKYKAVFLGVWALGILLLLSTVSYGGTVSLGIALIVTLFLLPKPFDTLKKIGIGAIVIVGLIVAINAPHLPKWEQSITSSRLTRLEFWGIAVQVIHDHFWTGIGLKGWDTNYVQLVEKYHSGSFPINWASPHPHDFFLDSLVKAGVFGLIGIVGMQLWPLVEGWAFSKSFKEKSPWWWFGLSMAAYGAAMMWFGLIDDPLWSDDTVPILFIFCFVLAYVVVRAKSKAVKEIHV